jgi:hypothetical protein
MCAEKRNSLSPGKLLPIGRNRKNNRVNPMSLHDMQDN